MLLDTHVLLWLRLGDPELGPGTRTAIEEAWQSDDLAVSAISFWEVAMLRAKGRIEVTLDVAAWRREQLEQGLVELPVDGVTAVRAGLLPDMHGDPADRLIVATALPGHRLATADRHILNWSGRLTRLDARE